MLLGVGLIVIGYAGTFFGKLIKAAVSRQREFLADASAVQFTRNPQGIGGALLAIGAGRGGSLLRHQKSEELSHAFFSQGVAVRFTSLFATHPPLAERIKRVLPDWDGQFPEAGARGEARGPATARPMGAGKVSEAAAGFGGDVVFEQVGRPDLGHLLQARQLLHAIPEVLLKAARDPFASRALLLFLVLDEDEEIRKRQLGTLKTEADRGVYAETMRLVRQAGSLRREQRLPLIELALPTLRRLSEAQSKIFLENLEKLIRIDGKITLFEWCLRKIVIEYRREYFEEPAGAGSMIGDLEKVAGDCAVLLSTLVRAVRHSGMTPPEVFAMASRELAGLRLELIEPKKLGLAALDASLEPLKRLRPRLKARVFKACIVSVQADGRIDPVEAELLRVVAATLAVPIPPPKVG